MRFRYDGKVWKLWFKYTVGKKRRETLCLIEIDGTEETFAVGATECSVKDKFNKVVGRELALFRCLQKCVTEFGMTNEFWKAAMSCYKKRAEQPKGVASGN